MALGVLLIVLGGWAAVAALQLAGTAIGMYALILGRVPGRWLQRNVEHPRIWGAGALFLAAGVSYSSTVAIIGAGLITLGYLNTPTFNH
ncbi:hypothetical protein ABZZ47_43450 [Streptomyces sp. NPDC006465]|uniref:hypothetical protein n=1 Tax=Streptomyces sp. NPDC006465 TaxID=3157174 RepID=UPI0033BA422D